MDVVEFKKVKRELDDLNILISNLYLSLSSGGLKSTSQIRAAKRKKAVILAKLLKMIYVK